MKASDLFARCLEEEGVRFVFGVPGEENADIMLSLEDSSVRFVMTRHEQAAAFMAEVHGRLTGDPAVCLGTLGPGATNLLTGVADANMDRAPMIALTGQAGARRRHKESHQVIDVVDMMRPVTKWTCSILTPDTIPEVIRKAVRTARSEKPGAVHIELPEDVAGEEVDARPMPPRRFIRPAPNAAVTEKAWRAIRAARRPIVIAGNGAIRDRASKELRTFCATTGIGALSTFMGKGSLDMDDPRCLFTIGLQQRDFAALAIDAADLVICIGYDLVEYPPRLWNPDGRKSIVHLDFEPAEIDAEYHPAHEMAGDIADGLRALTAHADADGPGDWDFDAQHRCRSRMLEEFSAYADDDQVGKIRPQKAIWDARAALGPDDVLLSGVGAHKMWIGRMYQCHEPNTCLIPNGFCSMGMPLPGAIAAKLVRPEAKILAIAGDGDVMMNVQEMETAARLGVDINVMVWEDFSYGLIEWKQLSEFGRHTDLSFGNPDWDLLARAFGWRCWRTDRSADLGGVLREAIAHEGPSLIVIPIDYSENMKLEQRLGSIDLTL